MSYCRWSSNSYRSDVYCQRTDRGFETHIAVLRRVLGDDVRAPSVSLLECDADRFDRELLTFTTALDQAHRIPIGLAHDGEVFIDTSEAAMFERLAFLADAGYRVPSDMLVAAEASHSLAIA